MRKRILYFGWYMPYDSVSHAGGQVFNYYVKEMAKYADVTVIANAFSWELKNSSLENYGVKTYYIENKKISFFKKLLSINSIFNPWHKYGHIVYKHRAEDVIKHAKLLKSSGYNPDIIVLQWTQMVLLIDEISIVFPNTKIVAVEEDVTYQRLLREANNSKGIVGWYKQQIYKNEKKRELDSLKKADLIYVNNYKDKNLLEKEKIDYRKINVLVPYYHKCSLERSNEVNNKDILFFGDMRRPENYTAAIWFATKIMNKINIQDARFFVMGAHPERIRYLENEKVCVTGFVDNPEVYFSTKAIFVAPLVYGAGIKIKVLEAMSSGIPVVTTEVGIEGIPATDKKDFFLYKTEQEIIDIIHHLLLNPIQANEIGLNGKKLIEKNFDYIQSFSNYSNTILSL